MPNKSISSTSRLPFFLFFLLTCFSLCNCVPETNGMFVFGSSLVDNGNNNFVNNSAKANYLPYGIDYPRGPSGRFSNRKNIVDVLGHKLKLPHVIPAFFHPKAKGKKILGGVNYASGGSGILDETGNLKGRAISLNEQIENFEKVTLPDLRAQVKCNNTNVLSNYLFVIGAGGNDLLFHFSPTNTKKQPLQDFVKDLTVSFSRQIMTLYSLGARKFVLISVYPMGCIPVVKKTLFQSQGCVESLNSASQLFNSKMKSFVDVLKGKMHGSNLVFVNSYHVIKEIVVNPTSYGFKITNDSCCEVNSSMGDGHGIMCKRGGSACKDRRGHVFFDGLHPTEAVNMLIANMAYSSSIPNETYPFNVHQLALL